MNSIKTKLEKLEAKYGNDGTTCPHLPPIVKYFEPDGEPDKPSNLLGHVKHLYRCWRATDK